MTSPLYVTARLREAVRVLTADLHAAADLLRTAADVTLLGHVNPDADALGSALALGLALRKRGATVRVSFGPPAEVPDSLRCLDPAGLVVPAADVPAAPELLVALDAGSAARLGWLADRVGTSGQVLVVDHHASNTRYGTHHVVDDTAEATAVLVLALIDELGIPLDPDIARCLYAGLMTDTGSFRRATSATHRTAARLVEAGAEPAVLARELMDAHPFAWLPMLARVLGRAELEQAAVGGRGLVHTAVTMADMTGVRLEEVESVVDILRATSEAEVALVIKEMAPGEWSGSLRAKSAVDVRVVAAGMGGGGHRLAAGFTTTGTAEDVVNRVREMLRQPPVIASQAPRTRSRS
ncbi:DHH family phosphoesterase [Actinophytocola glycyrrhizae]|uniref:Bifunctional oligoribonuclease/PAP phosphatase NrnA n=1 Tax=Actinophytocola glycyrrhizae TaxID=2044873 RepID=A0ABV9S9U8_9PSEU